MKAWILLMLALTLPMAAQAEEAKEGEAPKVSYISLSPPFVGNYGLDGTAKLKVYKADIALRVTGDEAAKLVCWVNSATSWLRINGSLALTNFAASSPVTRSAMSAL